MIIQNLVFFIEAAFLFAFPLPWWADLLIFIGLYFLQFLPFAYYPVTLAGWIGAYVYLFLTVSAAQPARMYAFLVASILFAVTWFARLPVCDTRKLKAFTALMGIAPFVASSILLYLYIA